MTGFGVWQTLEELSSAIREQRTAMAEATGVTPTEMIVGADIAVALSRFGLDATGEIRRLKGLPGAYAVLGTLEGLELLTPLKPEKGCGGCEMPCHRP